MEQLRFTAVHEDGQHLVLSTADGTEVLLPVDARLRSALRSRSAPADVPATPLSPRNVQAMIRAGQSPEEVAEITGWPAERVARFEGPILAEREHVSSMAQSAHVRGRAPEGGVPTLGSRVLDRLAERGVDTDNVGWDATRPEGGAWTVVVSFVAGQRQRAAAWRFDPQDRTVEALDDEARWLSEDEQALPGIAAAGPSRGRAPAKPLLSNRTSAGEVELMTSMRERSRSRGRRKKTSTSSSDPAGLPQLEHAPDDVLPLEDLAYDPDTMGLPPAAHGESPAPEAAAEAPPAEEERAPESTGSTPSGIGTNPAADDHPTGRSGYDVPLQFDDDEPLDEEVLDATASDPGPQHATLNDLFGPEDEDNEAPTEDAAAAMESVEDAPTDGDSDEDDSADDESDAIDLELELGEEPVAEDAVELGGDLDDDKASGPHDTDSPAEPDAETVTDGEPAPVTDGEPAPVTDGEPAPVTDGEPAPDAESDTPGTTAEDAPAGKQESADSSEQPAAKPKRRKDGRPGVPSWDDIMFGAKDRRS